MTKRQTGYHTLDDGRGMCIFEDGSVTVDGEINTADLKTQRDLLLAACRALVDEYDNGDDDNGWERLIDAMRAAIAKAEGNHD